MQESTRLRTPKVLITSVYRFTKITYLISDTIFYVFVINNLTIGYTKHILNTFARAQCFLPNRKRNHFPPLIFASNKQCEMDGWAQRFIIWDFIFWSGGRGRTQAKILKTNHCAKLGNDRMELRESSCLRRMFEIKYESLWFIIKLRSEDALRTTNCRRWQILQRG